MLTRKTAKLNVSRLEDRWNPAAYDLSTAGSSQQAYEAIFEQHSGPSVSSLDTFVSLSGRELEQGYNTDAAPQFDEIDTATHALQRNDLPLVDIGGVAYREFVLDVQEGNNSTAKLVSLDDLKVFKSTLSGGLTGLILAPRDNSGGPLPPRLGGLGHADLIYDLDRELYDPVNFDDDPTNDYVPQDNYVVLDGKLAGRNGTDMLFYLPDSLFGAATDNPYVYLYSSFGVTHRVEGKAESWARATDGTPVGPHAPWVGTISGTDLGTPTSPPVVPPPPPPPPSDDGTVWN